MYNLTSKINEAVQDCITNGSSQVVIDGKEHVIIINAEYEPMDGNKYHDIVTVYISEDGIDKFRYQIEETMTPDFDEDEDED